MEPVASAKQVVNHRQLNPRSRHPSARRQRLFLGYHLISFFHGTLQTPLPKQGGAESGTLSGDDERLRLLLKAWPDLVESVRDAVRYTW